MGQVIKSLYKGTTNEVRAFNQVSERFTTDEGVRQGSSLSPLLFITAIDEVMKECKIKFKRYYVGYHSLQPIHLEMCTFADDIILMADSESKLEHNLQKYNDIAKRFGLKINDKKTEILRISEEEKGNNKPINIKVDGRLISGAEQYKYLGTIINRTGTQTDEINNRINQTNKLFYALDKETFLRNKNISRETKMKVYRSVYVPTLLYGCENWVLNRRQEQRIVAMQMKYIRRVTGSRRLDKIRNTALRRMVRVPSILIEVEKRKMRWFGHIIRMDEQKPARMVWRTRAQGRNGRGRPRRKWDDGMVEILRRME